MVRLLQKLKSVDFYRKIPKYVENPSASVVSKFSLRWLCLPTLKFSSHDLVSIAVTLPKLRWQVHLSL
jgi:hypothetical protein